MIGEIAHRQLCGDRADRADGQSQAELDKPDPPSLLQKQDQRRQYQRMEMADEMRCRDQPDRLIFAPSLNASSNCYLRRHAAFPSLGYTLNNCGTRLLRCARNDTPDTSLRGAERRSNLIPQLRTTQPQRCERRSPAAWSAYQYS